MRQLDVIGVVRKHRWASLDVQRLRLQEDGCERIIDLDAVPRDWLLTAIRERSVIKATFACLLTHRRGVRAGLKDFASFMSKIAKTPRGCVGVIKDLDTGLIADTPGARKAMLSVVREQLMRSTRGLAISEAAKRGRKPLWEELTLLQRAQGEAIWRNPRLTWDEAEAELKRKVHKELTKWSAHKFWKARDLGAKRAKR